MVLLNGRIRCVRLAFIFGKIDLNIVICNQVFLTNTLKFAISCQCLKMISLFLKHNERQIKNVFFWSALFFTTASSIVFFIVLLYVQKMNWILVFIVIFCSALVLPIALVLLIFWRWRRDVRVLMRNFNAFPFSSLGALGFKKMFSDENSLFHLSTIVYKGRVEPFEVVCDVNPNDSEYLRFKYFVQKKMLSQEDFQNLQSEFAKQHGSFDFDFISKNIHRRNPFKSLDELKKELVVFAKILVEKGIEPM